MRLMPLPTPLPRARARGGKVVLSPTPAKRRVSNCLHGSPEALGTGAHGTHLFAFLGCFARGSRQDMAPAPTTEVVAAFVTRSPAVNEITNAMAAEKQHREEKEAKPEKEEVAAAEVADRKGKRPLEDAGGPQKRAKEDGGATAASDDVDAKFSEAVRLIHDVDGSFDEAIDLLTDVLERKTAKYGELEIECAPAFYQYGLALFGKARMENDVFGEPVQKAMVEKAIAQMKAEAEKEAGAAGEGSNAKAEGASGAANAEDDGAENIDGSEDEDEDEENDMELAWRNLETARLIYSRASGHEQALADVYSALAELSMEREDMETSIADFRSAIGLVGAGRVGAEYHYKLCIALQLMAAQQKTQAQQGQAEPKVRTIDRSFVRECVLSCVPACFSHQSLRPFTDRMPTHPPVLFLPFSHALSGLDCDNRGGQGRVQGVDRFAREGAHGLGGRGAREHHRGDGGQGRGARRAGRADGLWRRGWHGQALGVLADRLRQARARGPQAAAGAGGAQGRRQGKQHGGQGEQGGGQVNKREQWSAWVRARWIEIKSAMHVMCMKSK